MPKEVPGIPTEVLQRELSSLDGLLLITPQQAAMILSRTTKQLSDDRSAGRPPPFTKVGGSNRYRIGVVRDYIESNSHNNTRQATLKKEQEASGFKSNSFSAFINEGRHDDQWPFMVEAGKPIEFFHSLTLSLSDESVCKWLSLDQYLKARRDFALAQPAMEEKAAITTGLKGEGHLRPGPKKKPPL